MALRLAPVLRPPSSRRSLRRVGVALAVLAVIAALGLAVLLGFRFARAGAVVPNVHLAGVDMGGTPADQLPAALGEIDRADEVITVVVDDSDGQAAAQTTAGELGYRLRRQPTLDAVMARGRQANPFAALNDHLRATWSTLTVDPIFEVDEEALAAGAASLADELVRPPVEGDLDLTGGVVERIEPADGHRVDVEGLTDRLRPVVHGEADTAVVADRQPVASETTSEDVDRVAAEAEHALSAPVTLTRGDVRWTLEPADLGAALTVERDGGELSLVSDAETVDELAGDVAREVDRAPRDATVHLSDGSPTIEPSQDGFAFNAEKAAVQVLELATGDGARSAELDGDVLTPDRTTEDARALNITEEVATFTTEFTAGQSRVQNIQRMAEMVDGALLEPGETLSINDYVGERTREKGFTDGGAILDGEFITDVGGGVSQFATTMYNAAYFGGYDIIDFKAHSYYISRYPVGREATLDFPHVDLAVRNTSPHGLLVATSSDDTSVTVTIWGTKWVEVDSERGERRNVTPPPTEHRDAPDLPEGTQRVVQQGREGFTITVTRVLRFPDGTVEREPVTTRYQPEPRIIEIGSGDDDS